MPSGEKTKLKWEDLSFRTKVLKTMKESWAKRKVRIKKICLECKKEFEVIKQREKTAIWCSLKCLRLYKFNRIERICKNCKKVFLIYPERLERNAGKFCSDKCRYENFNLKGNPNWKGGKSFEPYPLGWTHTYKEQIRLRDEYKCQMCGIPEIEYIRKLDVHHKDYNKNNLKENNLISVCAHCHGKMNYNREYWKEYFNVYTKA